MFNKLKRGISLASAVALTTLGNSLIDRVQAQTADIISGRVNLAWDKSPSANVSNYNFYAGPSSRKYFGISYLNNVTNASLPAILNKKTYYAVTAKNTAGLESDFSNEIGYQPVTLNNYTSSIVNIGGTNFYKVSYTPNPVNSEVYFSSNTNANTGYTVVKSITWLKVKTLESRSTNSINNVITSTIQFKAPSPLPKQIYFTPAKCANPSNVKLTPKSTGISVSFSPANYNGLDHYNIYAKRASDGVTSQFTAPVNVTNGLVTKLITGLRTNNAYAFTVGAYVKYANGAFEGQKTSPLSATFTGKDGTTVSSSYANILQSDNNQENIPISDGRINTLILNDGEGTAFVDFFQKDLVNRMPHRLISTSDMTNWNTMDISPEYITNSSPTDIMGRFSVPVTQEPKRFFKVLDNGSTNPDY